MVHAAWLYDYFWIQRKDILPLTSTTMALLCRCLNIPISWRKCELSHTVHWIGWTFRVAAGLIALPEPKRSKMLRYIDKLLASPRAKRPDLEKAIGLDMWGTQLFPNMRIWLQYLNHDLYTLPSANYSIDPDNCKSLAPCLNEQMTFVKRPPGTMIPIGGTLVSVRRIATPDLDALQTVRISDKRISMRIKDPNSERRRVSTQSHRILQLYKQWLSNSAPYMLLRPKKVWQGLAAADAFAAGDLCGIGGVIRSPSGETHWFSERYTGQHFADLNMISKVTYKNPSPVWKHWHRLQSCGNLAAFIQDIAFLLRCLPFPTTPELRQVAIACFLQKTSLLVSSKIVSSFNHERYGNECRPHSRTYQHRS